MSLKVWLLDFSYLFSGFETKENERSKDSSGNVTGPSPALRQPLSETKLAALCTEVWPVLALIGGVDNGLRAGGLCLHKPSARRAILLGVLKEGSSTAKLQWEEADLSVRYLQTYIHTQVHFVTKTFCFLNVGLLLTSIKQWYILFLSWFFQHLYYSVWFPSVFLPFRLL